VLSSWCSTSSSHTLLFIIAVTVVLSFSINARQHLFVEASIIQELTNINCTPFVHSGRFVGAKSPRIHIGFPPHYQIHGYNGHGRRPEWTDLFKVVHTTIKYRPLFVCSLCNNYSATSYGRILTHIEDIHQFSAEFVLTCHFCPETFTKMSSYKYPTPLN